MKKRNPYLTVGLVMTGILTALIVLGFFWTPYDPNAMAAGPKLTGPSLTHLMGTDSFGRDIFSRVLKGAGTTYGIALCTVAVGAVCGTVLGAHGEYILSPKLDDLACVWGCTEGFLSAGDSGSLPVLCIFDNEEVGSATKQGAASTFLRDTLRRISLALGQDEEAFQTTLARSFLVSADNAHAIHPDHPEYADRGNCPRMNGGVVIKFNANQRYATDGRSCAVFRAACAEAGVPVQLMANRSDLPGGSTLGSIAGTLVPVSTVDIGLAQLAMHSSWETMGAQDCAYLAAAAARIFETEL